MKNRVQLIAYADRCGGTGLKELAALLRGPWRGLFGTVHVLPFFHPIDGADAGFDPIDHMQVDARLGSWSDVRALASEVDLIADVIVNHISSGSSQFRDFMQKGALSRFDGLFLTLDAVFPGGALEHQLTAIYRPRPGLPFTPVTLEDGTKRILWTTFTPAQIDIDVQQSQGKQYLAEILRALADNGIRAVRLDAVGYAIKKAGSSCFMLPETFEFISEFAGRARDHGMEVLVEVHSHYLQQISIAARVDWVYDFALPPLVLHALFFGTARYLKHWIGIRPKNALTVLDTHDGIGVIDIGADPLDRMNRPGLVPPAELDRLVELIHEHSGGASRRATGAAAANVDLYQVNCTFYEALGRRDADYLIARAVQFFLPGIPQVYYVGLLAGCNDVELLERTGVGRDINRHYYERAEIEAALDSSVVQGLIVLIQLRNSHPAFNGRFELRTSSEETLEMAWDDGADIAVLSVDFARCSCELQYSQAQQLRRLSIRRGQAEL
jgi:sucrose phosphorylase